MEEKIETKKNETHTHATQKLAAKEGKPAPDAHAAAAKESKEAPAKKADAAPAKAAADSKAKPGKKAEEKEEKKRELVLERVCIVPLVHAYEVAKTRRLQVAIKIVRQYAARHAKSPIAKVKIATQVNEYVRTFGSSHVHKKVKIRLTKDKEGGVLAELAK